MSEPGEQLSASGHALLALRLVGVTLCRLVGDWLRMRGGPAAVAELLAECRAQQRAFTGPLRGIDDGAGPRTIEDEESALRERLRCAGIDGTPLTRLVRNACLQPLDVDLLLLAALPDESVLWSALFQSLGGVGLNRPTVHFALNLWATSPAERVTQQLRLSEGPLAQLQLLRLLPTDAPFASRALCLPDRLWLALLGSAGADPLLDGALVCDAPPAPREPVLPPEAREELARLNERLRYEGRARVILRGPAGAGRRGTARWLARQLGREPIEVRWPTGEPKAGFAEALVRHALVRDAALLLLAEPGNDESLTFDFALPETLPALAVVSERCELLGSTFADADLLHLSPPRAAERVALWRSALVEQGLDEPDPEELGRLFRLRGDEIGAALKQAMRHARLAERATPTLADLSVAVRERPARRLESLTRRRRPRASWAELVVPPLQLRQLREVTERVRYRDRVFDEWSVASHASRQVGVAALFAGPSGTGKTLAAEVIAGDLGLDLYCVDLAQTVSKYIGETEKGLARIFDAAEGTAAVLFFDEADALFGKRTETRDAHDRYANQEVSYLLTRLESFDGITILASNLRQNIDAAFLRRMDFVIEFAPPDAPGRAQIWERHLRCNAPMAPEVSAQWLADTFPVSGAHIRNAVVAAAFGAAADGQSIGVPHLIAAMRREYEKLGKPFPVHT